MKIYNYDDFEVQSKIKEVLIYPYEFNDFLDFDYLSDGVIALKCVVKTPADPKREWVPAYHFKIRLDDFEIGSIDLRIGYTEGLYYGGNIGYGIKEAYRGKGYAGRACLLVAKIAQAHKMQKLIITNEYRNNASRRVCEKIGALFIHTVKLPMDNEMRKDGNENQNIFILNI